MSAKSVRFEVRERKYYQMTIWKADRLQIKLKLNQSLSIRL